jgi:predicted ATPase
MQLKTNKEFRSLHQAITEKKLFVDYTSKTSLNEMLSILAVHIRNRICHQIAAAGCFSALIDESKDKGKREELAFSVRYYTEKVQERFLSLTAITKFDAEAISAVAKDLSNPTKIKWIAYYQSWCRWR